MGVATALSSLETPGAITPRSGPGNLASIERYPTVYVENGQEVTYYSYGCPCLDLMGYSTIGELIDDVIEELVLKLAQKKENPIKKIPINEKQQ